jgi:predicted dehydrogenase
LARPGPYTGWDPKSDWYYDRDNIGVLYDQGSHAIDLIRYVCDLEITNVSASTTKTLPGLEVPDSIVATFRTDSDAVGTLNLTWGACANLDMLTVHGTAGSIIVSWNYFEHLKPGGGGVDKMMTLLDNVSVIVKRVLRSVAHRPSNTDPYLLINQDFVSCVSNGASPRVTAWDGVRALEVLNRMADSLTAQEKAEVV